MCLTVFIILYKCLKNVMRKLTFPFYENQACHLLSKLWPASSKLSNSFRLFRGQGKHHSFVTVDEELRIKYNWELRLVCARAWIPEFSALTQKASLSVYLLAYVSLHITFFMGWFILVPLLWGWTACCALYIGVESRNRWSKWMSKVIQVFME